MGVIAEFINLPPEVWSRVLPHIQAARIDVDDAGSDQEVVWFRCRRGRAWVTLAYCPADSGRE